MLARTEDEFESMQGMDLERRRTEAREVKRLPRLIEENELPQWLVKNEEEVKICLGSSKTITLKLRAAQLAWKTNLNILYFGKKSNG